jgi:hypothetical protein
VASVTLVSCKPAAFSVWVFVIQWRHLASLQSLHFSSAQHFWRRRSQVTLYVGSVLMTQTWSRWGHWCSSWRQPSSSCRVTSQHSRQLSQRPLQKVRQSHPPLTGVS